MQGDAQRRSKTNVNHNKITAPVTATVTVSTPAATSTLATLATRQATTVAAVN